MVKVAYKNLQDPNVFHILCSTFEKKDTTEDLLKKSLSIQCVTDSVQSLILQYHIRNSDTDTMALTSESSKQESL